MPWSRTGSGHAKPALNEVKDQVSLGPWTCRHMYFPSENHPAGPLIIFLRTQRSASSESFQTGRRSRHPLSCPGTGIKKVTITIRAQYNHIQHTRTSSKGRNVLPQKPLLALRKIRKKPPDETDDGLVDRWLQVHFHGPTGDFIMASWLHRYEQPIYGFLLVKHHT